MSFNHYIFPIPEIEEIIFNYLDPITDLKNLIQVNKYYFDTISTTPIYLELKSCQKDNFAKIISKYKMRHTDKYTLFLWKICLNGCLCLMKYLLKKYPNEINIHEFGEFAFCLCCKHGWLDLAKKLFKFSQSKTSKPINLHYDSPFWFACHNGHFKLVKWLYHLLKSSNISIIDYYRSSQFYLNYNCKIAKWLYDLNHNHHEYSHLFMNNNLRNHIKIVKFLYKFTEFDFVQHETDSNRNDIFSLICEKGHLEMAKWSYDMSRFNNRKLINIHHKHDRVFRNSCLNGHIEMAQWLYKSCELYDRKLINIHSNEEYVFRHSCKNGHLEMAQWLYQLSKSNHKIINIHSNNDFAFRNSCRYGHLKTMKWLYQLSQTDNHIRIDIHLKNDFAYRISYANKDIDTLKWLWSLCQEYESFANWNLAQRLKLLKN